MKYPRVFIFALCRPYQQRYSILNANTSQDMYIDSLSPPWRHTHRGRCNRLHRRRCNRCPLLSPRITASVILAPSGCCLPRCAPGLSRTGSREAEPTTGCPFRRRRIFLASERASDRLSSAERKVGACKTRRRVAGHLVCTRSLARPRRPWRESAFVLSHTPTYAGQRQPWLRPSSPRRFVYWLSCENRPTTCGFFDSASSPRPPLDLLLFFPLLMNFREIKHPQSVS